MVYIYVHWSFIWDPFPSTMEMAILVLVEPVLLCPFPSMFGPQKWLPTLGLGYDGSIPRH